MRVDANVILRFLLDDPPEMAEQAAQVFQLVSDGRLQLLVDDLIVAELVWVLKSFYKKSVAEITAVLRQFLLADGIILTNQSVILQALALFETYNVDFIDALLTARMQKAGHDLLISFDKHFDRLPGVQRIHPQNIAGVIGDS